jgi:hypothetical protein
MNSKLEASSIGRQNTVKELSNYNESIVSTIYILGEIIAK